MRSYIGPPTLVALIAAYDTQPKIANPTPTTRISAVNFVPIFQSLKRLIFASCFASFGVLRSVFRAGQCTRDEMRPLGLAMGHFAADAEGFKLRFFSLE